MARIFQDSAGTIPVTTFDQPVGKIVRGAGTVDLVQNVSGSRPTMARWPRGGRRNLLKDTVNLDTYGTSNAVISKDGGLYKIVPDSGITGSVFPDGITPTPRTGKVSFSVDLKSAGLVGSGIELRTGGTIRSAYVDLTDGSLNNVHPDIDATVVELPDGWWRLSASAEDLDTRLRIWGSGFGENGDGTSGVYFRNPQLEFGSEASPYQRVTTENDVTEEGVESLWHLYNDGGDSLQTDGPVPAGTYGYAWIDPYGEITFDTRTSDGINPVVVADDPGRYLDIILREGDFSAGEKVAITDYWERLYK